MGTGTLLFARHPAAHPAGADRPAAHRLIGSRVIFKRGSLQPLHAVFAAAFLLRLIALARLASSNLLDARGSDMRFYHEWAVRIVHGQFTDHLAFYGLPLYAWWLAAIYKVFGSGVFVPLLVQCAIDAATAALIYNITTVIAQRKVAGVLAAVGWMFCVPAQAYAVALLPTSFGVFVLWFVVWQVVRSESALTSTRCFLLALLIGITAMAVANALIAAALLLAVVIVRTRGAGARALAIIAGVLIGTSPCWIHNTFVARDPVFLSAHSGVNFWIGNNPEATGYPHFPGLRSAQSELLADSIDTAEAAAGHPLKRSEVSRFWSRQARHFITSQPLHWLQLSAGKLAHYWNAFEYDDVGVIESFRRANVILPGLHFAAIAAFAVPGISLGLRRRLQARWVAVALLLQMLSVVALFVTERYRLAAVPGLLMFAAITVTFLAEAITKSRWRSATITAATVAIAASAFSMPRADPTLVALKAYQLGRDALANGDLATAQTELSRAAQYVPRNAETKFALGNLRVAEGDRGSARDFYRATLELEPRHKGALTNLGLLALDGHDFAAARTYFSRAAALAPHDAKAHFLLAKSAFELRDLETADAEISRAIALDQTQAEFLALRDEITKAAHADGK